MRLRWKKSCLAVGCLSVVMLSAVIVVKTQGTGGSLSIWNSTGGWDEAADMAGRQEQNVNGTNGREQDAGGMDRQEQSKDSADGQDENTEAGRGETNIKRVALTFDDGPHPRYTKQLLEGLRERNVHVTFFVLGQSAELYPDLILEMAQDGHLIGNHTYSHIQLTNGNGQRFAEELQKTDAVIYEITGQHTEFVRPPYGVWNKRYEESLNMIQVLWNVDPLDWCCTDAGTVVSRVMEKADEDCIILLHDVYESSVVAALTIVDELLARGYELVTVDEMILD